MSDQPTDLEAEMHMGVNHPVAYAVYQILRTLPRGSPRKRAFWDALTTQEQQVLKDHKRLYGEKDNGSTNQ